VTAPRVFVSRVLPDEGLRPIREACDATIWEDELPPPRDALLRAIEGCAGVLTLLTTRSTTSSSIAPARSSRS
jgi:glyoxylate reductase